MADTIRDVIIRIGIQQQEAKLATPDFSAWTKAAEDASAKMQAEFSKIKFPSAGDFVSANSPPSAQELVSGAIPKPSRGGRTAATPELVKSSEEALAAIDRIYEEMRKETNDFATDLDKAGAAELEALRKKVVAELELQRQEVAAAEETATKKKAAREKYLQILRSEAGAAKQKSNAVEEENSRAKAAEDAARRAIKAKREEIAINQKLQTTVNTVTESIRASGEGAFRALRGIALISTDTDDGLQKILDRVRLIQGAWDVFSGTIQLGKGVLRAFTAVEIASEVASLENAAAKGMVASQNQRVATTAAAAAAAETVLTGALTGSTAASVATTTTAKTAVTFVAQLGSKLAGLAASAAAGAIVLGVTSYAIGAFGDENKTVQKEVDLTTRKLDELRKTASEIGQLKLKIDLAVETAKLTQPVESAEKLVKLAQLKNDIEFQGFMVAARRNSMDLENTRDKDKLREGVNILEIQKDIQQKLIDIEKERLGVLQEQRAELDRQAERNEKMVRSAREAVLAEKERVAGIAGRLGALNPIELIEFKNLSDKVKAGQQLSPGESARAGQLGATEFAEREKQKAGAKHLDLFTPFNVQKEEIGPDGKINQPFPQGRPLQGPLSLQNDLERSTKAAQSLMEKAKEPFLKAASELNKQSAETLQSIGDIIIRVSRENNKLQMDLKQRLSALEQDIHNGRVANRPF